MHTKGVCQCTCANCMEGTSIGLQRIEIATGLSESRARRDAENELRDYKRTFLDMQCVLKSYKASFASLVRDSAIEVETAKIMASRANTDLARANTDLVDNLLVANTILEDTVLSSKIELRQFKAKRDALVNVVSAMSAVVSTRTDINEELEEENKTLASLLEESSAAERMYEEKLRICMEGMEEKKICCVCMDGDATFANKKCGHRCACERCYQRLRECPMCRAASGWLQIYAT